MIGDHQRSRASPAWPAGPPCSRAFAKAAWLAHRAGVQPVQVQLVPGERRAAVVTGSRACCRSRSPTTRARRRLAELPPVLTFQSVLDFTVSTRAIVDALYAHLPANGSELVLFDLNRSAAVRPAAPRELDGHARWSACSRTRRATTGPRSSPTPARTAREVVARVIEAGARRRDRPRLLGLSYPRDVFSLSHVALPFPLDDALYGLQPDLDDDYGVNLGAMALRGERGTLVVRLDSLIRMSSNPFFPFMLARIDDGIGRPPARPPRRRSSPGPRPPGRRPAPFQPRLRPSEASCCGATFLVVDCRASPEGSLPHRSHAPTRPAFGSISPARCAPTTATRNADASDEEETTPREAGSREPRAHRPGARRFRAAGRRRPRRLHLGRARPRCSRSRGCRSRASPAPRPAR